MRLDAVRYGGGLPVEGYGPGFFRVGGVVHRGSILVTPGGVLAWPGGLAPADAGPLLGLAGEADLLFVGTGAALAPLPGGLRAALEAAGLGVEAMATPSACRAYTLCLGEGRRVAAALVPV
jgi:uncharacterized protein